MSNPKWRYRVTPKKVAIKYIAGFHSNGLRALYVEWTSGGKHGALHLMANMDTGEQKLLMRLPIGFMNWFAMYQVQSPYINTRYYRFHITVSNNSEYDYPVNDDIYD